jgi:hypothetical protein
MRERSSRILAVLIFATGPVLANHAAAHGNAAKADAKKFALEVTVINDKVVEVRRKLVAGDPPGTTK